jgi:NNP family nitrate/nitrite transporter-like MFS transporter
MIVGVLGVLYFLGIRTEPGAFWGFLGSFLLLFAASGVGNASTFQMIPIICGKERAKSLAGQAEAEIRRQAEKESAAIIGFTSAIAAFGAFFIPKTFGSSIAMTGGPEYALYVFIAYYATCIVATWWWYVRRGAESKC